MADESEEKTLQPSDQKLRKAREKGQVANSSDFVQAMTTVAGILYIIFNWQSFFNSFSGLFNMSVLSFGQNMTGVGVAMFMTVIFEMMYTIMPFIIVVILISVVANILDKKGIPFSLDPIKPDFAKINPGEGLKKLFKKRNATEFAMSFFKLVLWFTLSIIFIWLSLQTILASIYCSLGCVLDSATSVGLLLIVTATILLFAMGLLDMPLQTFLFKDEQKMGHNEMKRELKDMLGSPEFRQHRRSEHQKAVMGPGGNSSAQKPSPGRKKSDSITVVLRGSDKAIALYFHATDQDVPIVVQKYKGASLTRDLTIAKEAGVPVIDDQNTVNDIFRTIDLGQIIRERHFEKVARVLVAIGAIG